MLSTSKPIVKTSQNIQASWVIHEYFRFELLQFVHYWVIFYFNKTVSLYGWWLRVYLDSFILPSSYPHLWSFLVLQPEYSTRYPGYLRGYWCPGYVCYQTIINHGIDHRSWKGSSIGQLKIQVLQHFCGQEWYEMQTHISRFPNKCSIPRDKQRLIWDRLQCWLYPSNSYWYLTMRSMRAFQLWGSLGRLLLHPKSINMLSGFIMLTITWINFKGEIWQRNG